MTHRPTLVALIVGLVLSLGCDTPGERRDDVDAIPVDGIGNTDTSTATDDIPAPLPVPVQCIEDGIPCITQADCDAAAGTRCNTALPEPICQKIRCGGEGSICSDDAHCPDGMKCRADRCGTCGSVPDGGVCVNGEVRCQAGLTLCHSECVDLQSDSSHCGACNVQVREHENCQSGVPRCRSGYQQCNDACVYLLDDDNCGSCGQTCDFLADVCESGVNCWDYACGDRDGAMCLLHTTHAGEVICRAACAALDGGCIEGYKFVADDGGRLLSITCDEPADECLCSFAPRPRL